MIKLVQMVSLEFVAVVRLGSSMEMESTVAVGGSMLDWLLLGLFRLQTPHIRHETTTRSQTGQKSNDPTGKMMSDRLC